MNIGQRAIVGIVVVSVFVYFTSDSNKTANFVVHSHSVLQYLVQHRTRTANLQASIFLRALAR